MTRPPSSAPAADARVALLERLIDHAPLFPPASMTMPDALAEDRAARESEWAFMLARFVCPSSRLAELGDEERTVSAVLDGPPSEDPRVESVEALEPDDPAGLVGVAPEVYVELSVSGGLENAVARLQQLGLRAKVRCGGASTPTVAELARFVRACREAGAIFKATAGLHTPVRRGGEHGFLNLLAACVFGDEEQALADEDASAFVLTSDGFRWRDRLAGPEELARVRRELIHSIGSCSFFEPVEALEALGILPL